MTGAHRFLLTALALCIAPSAFAGRDPFAAGALKEEAEFNDTLEPMNRKILAFNMQLDKWAFKPLAEGYRWTVHPTLRRMARNALDNLSAPGSALNHLLQGDGEKAAYEAWGFVINSTLGAGGLMNVMEATGVKTEKEDFGQTLAVWGVPTGSYLVIPALGPSSGRDFGGMLVDKAADPMTYISDGAVSRTVAGADAVTAREAALDVTKEIESAALFDVYAAYRSAYLQNRIKNIKE